MEAPALQTPARGAVLGDTPRFAAPAERLPSAESTPPEIPTALAPCACQMEEPL